MNKKFFAPYSRIHLGYVQGNPKNDTVVNEVGLWFTGNERQGSEDAGEKADCIRF